MIRQFMVVLLLVMALMVPLTESASAQQASTLNLPPGITRQAEPLLEDMMERMPSGQMEMMADMQAMADQLPPGIFLQILQLMPSLEMTEMMQLHQALHDGDLLQQPPGQILRFVRELAG